MNRKTVSGLMLMLLFIGVLTFALHPIYATPTPCALEIPVDDENLHSQSGLTSPTSEWNKTYGGTNDDSARSVIETGDGGYAMAGWTDSFGAGNSDFWLVKTDSAGNVEWNQTYGGIDLDEGWSVVRTSDGGYALAGTTWSFGAGDCDFWLVKTDASGIVEWNQTYGGASTDSARSMVSTGDGGYALTGWTRSFGAGISNSWLVKTDAEGSMEWNQTYGGTRKDGLKSVVETSDGGYALAGDTSSFGAGDYDFWLVKTDASGNMVWNQTYGGTGRDTASSVVETGDGGYAIAGRTRSFGVGWEDFWLVKTDASGNMVWNQTYGGADYDEAWSMIETGDGGYAIAGNTDSFGPGRYDSWLVKTDAEGSMEWNQTYGGTGVDYAYSVVETSDGGYALAGGTLSFGAGDTDFWLIRLSGTTPVVIVDVDICPDTLNLRSQGRWIAAYIELPEGYNISDIDVSSIRLNETFLVDSDAPTQIGDYDSDGIPDLMVKFNRTELTSYLYNIVEVRLDTVVLTVSGELIIGISFEGSDIVRTRLAGDVNEDCVVDVTDLSMVGRSFGARIDEDAYEERLDLTCDGVIDVRDLMLIGINYGATIPE